MKKQKQFVARSQSGLKKFNGRQHIDDMYDVVWEKYSREFLRINPRCYSCGEKSEAVDHVEAHKGSEVLFKKLDNHIPLCHKCHNTVTSKFDKDYKPGSSIVNKLKWIAANRLRNQVDIRVKVLPSYTLD